MTIKIATVVAAFAFCVSLSGGAFAADEAKKPAMGSKKEKAGGEVTLSGDLMCGKCALKETEKCQNVLKVTAEGKDTKYFLAKNDVSEKSHSKVCGGSAKATIKGTVSDKDGKKVLTASDIKTE